MLTDGMDWKQRAEMDEKLEVVDRQTARQRRVEYARSLRGGEVVMAGSR